MIRDALGTTAVGTATAAGGSPTSPPYPGYPPPSPFHRRLSPPGSPSRKKCCFDQKDSYPKEAFLCCCCYTCPAPKTTSVFATVGVCFLVLGYTVLGAFTFMALEGGGGGGGVGGVGGRDGTAAAASKANPGESSSRVSQIRTQTVDKLWSITENLNILYRENWTRLAAEEVLEFQEALVRALRTRNGHVVAPSGRGGAAAFHSNGQHRWSFGSSFLYSLTLITTIGYGNVAPRTTWGKLVTVLYALIGIPLMLLYLSTTGDVLARSFRRLYGRICGIGGTARATTDARKGGGGGGGGGPRRCPCATGGSTVRVPFALCLLMVVGYVCGGAVLFHRLENWSILEGSYFCFTSLGTIGFGDLVPGRADDLSACACSAYIFAGMALVAMCFSLVQEEASALLRAVGAATTCSGRRRRARLDGRGDRDNVTAAMAVVAAS